MYKPRKIWGGVYFWATASGKGLRFLVFLAAGTRLVRGLWYPLRAHHWGGVPSETPKIWCTTPQSSSISVYKILFQSHFLLCHRGEIRVKTCGKCQGLPDIFLLTQVFGGNLRALPHPWWCGGRDADGPRMQRCGELGCWGLGGAFRFLDPQQFFGVSLPTLPSKSIIHAWCIPFIYVL